MLISLPQEIFKEIFTNYTANMYIAEEWLTLEKDVLGHRPLISGSVDEVRAAYRETSEALAQLYPSIDSYQIADRKCYFGNCIDFYSSKLMVHRQRSNRLGNRNTRLYSSQN
jgi:hypothetical protein